MNWTAEVLLAAQLSAPPPPPAPPAPAPDSELLEFLGGSDALDPEFAKYLADCHRDPSHPVRVSPKSTTAPAKGACT